MKLHFVWIGKTKDPHCAALIHDYLKRLSRFTSYEVSELKEVSNSVTEARLVQAESTKILAAIERDDFVIVCDEKGQHFSSLEWAHLVNAKQTSSIKRLAFIIGGFAGVSSEVKQRAHLLVALSPMTFPHDLARVILAEQTYRAFTLIAGLPYHRF